MRIGNSFVGRLAIVASAVLLLLLDMQGDVTAFFVGSAIGFRRTTSSRHIGTTSTQVGMAMERIEFTIHPDGRVEELVLGVKGDNCHKLTAELNEKLGTVIDTKPTEELFEQNVVVSNEQSITMGSGGTSNSDYGSSW